MKTYYDGDRFAPPEADAKVCRDMMQYATVRVTIEMSIPVMIDNLDDNLVSQAKQQIDAIRIAERIAQNGPVETADDVSEWEVVDVI